MSAPAATSPRIVAPVPPLEAAKPPFPLVATLTPVLMSAVLWLVTQSAFALLFAALGPAVAFATLADSRIGQRRRSRRDLARFEAEIEQLREEIAAEHEKERCRREAATPSATEIAARRLMRWNQPCDGQVRCGTGQLPSSLSLEGLSPTRAPEAASRQLRELAAEASRLDAVPLLIDSAGGIGVVAPPVVAAAFLRALLLQLLVTRSPASYVLRGRMEWLERLPYRSERRDDDILEIDGGGQVLCIATVRSVDELEAAVGAVIVLEGGRARILRGEQVGTEFEPELLSLESAEHWADAVCSAAERMGIAAAQSRLPGAVAFDQVMAGVSTPSAASLSCPIGLDVDGVFELDLLEHGPHAVVGGTTGSGKSEFLICWLLAMAACYPPQRVAFLLFDFKGGASFGDIVRLPHTVGLVTDLDEAGIGRAVASLSAELRHRERVIAAASARSIDEVDSLGRLVIVVDEFAAMAAELPELHAQFADLAARGRSLGVHLVLCTQRPSGVVRDSVLANASLRVSLRVNNAADSIAVIGTDEASSAGLPPGRALLRRADEPPRAVQIALATRHDIEEVCSRWPVHGDGPRRPWLDPLPRRILLAQLAPVPGTVMLGLGDYPAEQQQRPARWNPALDGSLLAIGGVGSGKSNLVGLAAAAGAQLLPRDIELAWDVLAAPSTELLAVDDVDVLLARFPADYQQAAVDGLATLLRTGGSRLLLTTQRLTPSLQSLAALCEQRLLLRMPNRQEHLLAGGSPADFDPGLPPGGAHWRGSRLQLALAPEPEKLVPAPRIGFRPTEPTLAVAALPKQLAARLGERGVAVEMLTTPALLRELDSRPRILLADPETWQSQWGVFCALAREHPVLFHGCSQSEFRQLSRRRELPPFLADSSVSGWLLDPLAGVSRVTV